MLQYISILSILLIICSQLIKSFQQLKKNQVYSFEYSKIIPNPHSFIKMEGERQRIEEGPSDKDTAVNAMRVVNWQLPKPKDEKIAEQYMLLGLWESLQAKWKKFMKRELVRRRTQR